MRKTIIILIATVMTLSVMTPMVIANGDDATESDPAYPSGYITQGQGAPTNIPIEIWGLWVEVNQQGPYDDDYTKMGCQVDPPIAHDGKVSVKFYAIIWDEEDDQQQIKFDLFCPDNPDIPNHQPGDGQLVPARAGIQDGYHIDPTFEDQDKTHYQNDIVPLDTGNNIPFICYKHGKTYNDVMTEWNQGDIWFKWTEYELYYHDIAGWYNLQVSTTDLGSQDKQEIWFEYVPTLGIEIDFDTIDWGNQISLYKWFINRVDLQTGGDWVFDNIGTVPPTMRNIGNWFTEVNVDFGTSNQGFATGDAFFDVRVGNEMLGAECYNESYAQYYSGDPTTEPTLADPAHDSCGLKLDTVSNPLPIDNPNDEVDDVLMICHTAKLNFYIFVTQWTLNQPGAEYQIPMIISVGLSGDPATGHIWPVERFPCTGEII